MTTQDPESKPKPVGKVQVDMVTAAIWENPTQNGVMHSVTLDRAYHDGKGWTSTKSLGRDNLLAGSKALELAHSRIHEIEAVQRKQR